MYIIFHDGQQVELSRGTSIVPSKLSSTGESTDEPKRWFLRFRRKGSKVIEHAAVRDILYVGGGKLK